MTGGFRANIILRLKECTRNMLCARCVLAPSAEIAVGPIVRITPEELSLHDPAAYTEIFVTENKRRTENYHPFLQGADFEGQVEV